MNRKQGFTLVELLAVIVILVILIAITLPCIIGIINNTKTSAYNDQMKLFKQAAALYSDQNGIESGNNSVTLQQLIDGNFLPSNIENPVSGQLFDTGMTVVINRSSGSPDYQIQEAPALVTGMIPVYYDDATGLWKKASILNPSNQWYDYNNQQWANAVTVITSSRATYQSTAVGTTINMSDISAFFVWIPRFKYRIPTGTGAREILVSFEAKNATKSMGNAKTTYYTHPAFTFGTTELSGIWVGKFETTGIITAPTILPNTQSLRSQAVKAMYDSVKTNMQSSVTYGFINDNDIHMMKNMEWGAVAYLTGSRYGKYGNASYTTLASKELFLNNSSSYYTGRSSGAPSGSGVLTPTNEYISAGYYTYDGKCATINAALPQCSTGTAGVTSLTNKTLAYGASTTGTIYGIYDISGGAYDYVMGLYESNPILSTGIADVSGYSSTTTNSQYNLLTINTKYYDRYLTDAAVTGAALGDGTKEISGWSGNAFVGWYGDYANFVGKGWPWFIRGGGYANGASAGTWYFNCTSGGLSSYMSFHVVLSPQS